MSYAPSSFSFSMAIGVNGAYVDVTSDVVFDQGSITRSWGTQSQFTAVSPGTYSFTLDNKTGNYTPDNPASTLATKVSEGTGVCWSLNGQLRAGSVRVLQPVFGDIGVPDKTARMRVTVEDMLGIAARTQMPSANLATSMVLNAPAYAYWPLNDAAGATIAAEASGNNYPGLYNSFPIVGGSATFGQPGVVAAGETQLLLVSPVGNGLIFDALASFPIPASYQSNSLGSWGFWYTPTTDPGSFIMSWSLRTTANNNLGTFQFTCNALSAGMKFNSVSNTITTATTGALALNVAHYFAVTITYDDAAGVATYSLYMDGVFQSTGTSAFTSNGFAPAVMSSVSDPSFNVFGGGSALVSHLSHTAVRVNETLAGGTSTEAGLFNLIGALSGSVTTAAAPNDLSAEPVTLPGTQNEALLDLLTGLANTEQGYLYATTSGTLLAPVQTLNLRARTRSATPAYSFDVSKEITGSPQFVRDIANTVSSVTVSGPSTSTIASNSALAVKVGSANASESVLNNNSLDQLMWGQDRINRGIKRAVDITSFTIDAFGTSAGSRWADLTSMKPGDRIRVTGMATANLGYATWDGWLIGCEETHVGLSSRFTLYLAPVLPDTAIFDTNLFMAGGDLALSAALTSSATSMSVSTVGAKLETAVFPYTLIIDQEQVTVTACSTATPQVATITRGANSTTAAAHVSGSLVEVAVPSLFAF